MNFLFLSELFYPHGGGAEYATYLYAKLLNEAKHNVIVITHRFEGEQAFSRDEGFSVYRLHLLNGSRSVKYSVLWHLDVLFSDYLRKWINWADVVYVPRYWFAVIPLAKALGKPVIVHLHDYIPVCPLAVLYDSGTNGVCGKHGTCSLRCLYKYESKRRNVLESVGSVLLNSSVWPFLRRFVECSDVVVCVSKAQKDLIIKCLPSLSPKIMVIHNPLPKLPAVHMSGDDLGYFGGPSYLKGFQVLLKALHFRKHRGLKPVIVHATRTSNVSRCLAHLMNDLGLVTYGKLENQEYNAVYRTVRAVVVPSVWQEPLPYVVTEAILRERVVVASAVGGIPEQTEGCRGVFLTEPGDWKGLANAIEKVSDLTREVAANLGNQNKEAFERKQKDEDALQNFVSAAKACSV